ncbi:MAG: DUF1275 domain-containing protein [Anaerolineae bacterium]|nr:DUF1275 domain-containing protein [Anaerolineae bacterium]
MIGSVQPGQQAYPLQRASRNEERFAAVFALIAGYADAYAYVQFRTYVSFMSGNTTTVGSMTGQGNYGAAILSLVAIVSYVIGVFSGTLLSNSGLRRPHRLLFGIIAVLLAVVVAITQLDSVASAICIALLSLAMGLMNTTLSHVGAQSVNLVFVTGTLSRMASHLALAFAHAPLPDAQGPWDTHRRRAYLLMGVWGSFLVGALAGGFATAHFGVGVLLIPALILIALAVFDYMPK